MLNFSCHQTDDKQESDDKNKADVIIDLYSSKKKKIREKNYTNLCQLWN